MNLHLQYGNFVSGELARSLPAPDADIGTEATILCGRDRHPAKVVGIERFKNGKVKAYVLQEYQWRMAPNGEGHAEEILWDQPQGEPQAHRVITSGHLKGTVERAFIGRADCFYDRTF